MEILIRMISILEIIVCISSIIFIMKNIKTVKIMQVVNKEISEYIKDKSFLLMKDNGDDFCNITEKFDMIKFSQEAQLFVERKML